MPDISMCMNATCKRSQDCYRFTAEPSEYLQSYGVFNCNPSEPGDMFWPNKKEKTFKITEKSVDNPE